MTQDEIIEMAKPFLWGGNVVEGWTFSSYEQLESFAKLVAAKEREACIAHAMTSAEKAIDVAIKLEREACANICEEEQGYKTAFCALKIRARGQANG